MIPGEPEPLAIGIKKAPLSSRRRGFFIAQWFGGHFIFDSDAVSCRSWLASDGR
ncbi:hypothetical protein AN403_1589 [Pseudomonas fluorescens]|uniref:Uncharacterized protein n=1 Tax=Pseudomonas fluorescens TaxID=294 RepID=A0A0P8WTT2_PSEFL|nr:hypothetical protein AN403_1589 [Pseudomonas fluorescens]